MALPGLPGSQPAYRQAPSNPAGEKKEEIAVRQPELKSTGASFLGVFKNAIQSTLPEEENGNKGTRRRGMIAFLDSAINSLEEQPKAAAAPIAKKGDPLGDMLHRKHEMDYWDKGIQKEEKDFVDCEEDLEEGFIDLQPEAPASKVAARIAKNDPVGRMVHGGGFIVSGTYHPNH